MGVARDNLQTRNGSVGLARDNPQTRNRHEALGSGLAHARSNGKGGKKGKKGGKKGKKGKKGGKGKEGPPSGRKIAGNCWNCDKPGHTSQDCRQPRREGLKSLEDDDDDDDNSDSDSDDESTGVAGLSLGCLSECIVFPNFVDISWRVPNFDDLYNVSQEAASHLSDEAGESRNTYTAPLLAFSAVDSESSEESDEEDAELLKAVEDEFKSRREIEKDISTAPSEGGEGWTKVPAKGAGQSVVATAIRGKPLLEAYKNPFAKLAATDDSETEIPGSSLTADAPVENLVERMNRRLA